MMPAGRFMRQEENPTNKNKEIKLEPASNDLAENLRKRFPIGRLRTGTPPRLDKRSIDYTTLDP